MMSTLVTFFTIGWDLSASALAASRTQMPIASGKAIKSRSGLAIVHASAVSSGARREAVFDLYQFEQP